jgi:hypothetical protein
LEALAYKNAVQVEVHEQGSPARSEPDIGGFDISVNRTAPLLKEFQRAADLIYAELSGAIRQRPEAIQRIGEGGARIERHDDEFDAEKRIAARIEQGHQMGVLAGRLEPGLRLGDLAM